MIEIFTKKDLIKDVNILNFCKLIEESENFILSVKSHDDDIRNYSGKLYFHFIAGKL